LAGLVDSHAHLQHESFAPDLDAVLDRARAAGLVRILVPGWDLPSSEAALELAARHPDLLDAGIGIHPHYVAAATEADWSALETLARDPWCRAVGEIGLDFHRNLSPPDAQRAGLARQLELAGATGRPVLVHDREAHAEVTEALVAWAGRQSRAVPGILHCFSGDLAMALALVGAGFRISFALPITFSSNHGPRDAATAIPESALLVETDSPYLGGAPERRNEPTTTLRVAAELARLRVVEPETIAAAARSAYNAALA
jgi:TatD DNase family protein